MEETEHTYFSAFLLITKAINSSLDLSEVLRLIVQNTCETTGSKGCTLMLLDEAGETLEVKSSYELSDHDLGKGPLSADKSISDTLKGKPVIIEDAPSDPRLQYPQEAKREGIASMRFHTQHQAALKLIRDGASGKPVLGRAQLSCWYPPLAGAWRQDPAQGGGGSLMDMGGHCIDLLEMFFGRVRAVSCFANRTVHAYASEDSAVVWLQFANGALGVVDAFFCMPDDASQNRLELYGSSGSLLAKGTIGQGADGEMIAYLEGSVAGYDAQQVRSAGGGVALTPAPQNTYRAEIEEFSQAVLDDRDPSNSAGLGLQSQRVLAACYASAQSGRVISLDPPPDEHRQLDGR